MRRYHAHLLLALIDLRHERTRKLGRQVARAIAEYQYRKEGTTLERMHASRDSWIVTRTTAERATRAGQEGLRRSNPKHEPRLMVGIVAHL